MSRWILDDSAFDEDDDEPLQGLFREEQVEQDTKFDGEYDDIEDPFYEDALDYFALNVLRKFPAVQLHRIETRPWRQGWAITLPPQFAQRQALIDYATSLQDDLYMQKDYFVTFKFEDAKQEGPPIAC